MQLPVSALTSSRYDVIHENEKTSNRAIRNVQNSHSTVQRSERIAGREFITFLHRKVQTQTVHKPSSSNYVHIHQQPFTAFPTHIQYNAVHVYAPPVEFPGTCHVHSSRPSGQVCSHVCRALWLNLRCSVAPPSDCSGHRWPRNGLPSDPACPW